MPLPLIAGAAANAIIGMGIGKANDSRQLSQQEQLQQLQIEGQKNMGDFNRRQAMRMWEDTNYKAQVQQLKKAGLNPGLIYGMGGAGGTTAGAAPGSVTGGTAPVGGGEIQDMFGYGMQAGVQQAQKEVLETQADKNKAEADKIRGVDTKEAEGRIGILEVDKTLKEIEATVNQATKEDVIDKISFDTRKAMKELEIATVESGIARETIDEKIKIIEQTAIGAVLQNTLTKVQTEKGKQDIKLSKEQIKKWSEEIAQGWEQLDQNQQKIKLETWVQELKAQNISIGDAMGKQLNRLLENIDDIIHETKGRRRTYVAPYKQK